MYRHVLFGLLILSGLISQTLAEPVVVALAPDKKLVIFDPDGNRIRTIKLETSPRQYMAMTMADVMPSHPGRELVLLRDDDYVDIYPDPVNGSDPLKRLAYVKLNPAGGRKHLAMTAADFNPALPGDELLVLQQQQQEPTQYVYVYSLADGKPVAGRNDYFGLNSPYLPLTSVDVRAKGTALLAAGKDGRMETFVPAAKLWTRLAKDSFSAGSRNDITGVRFDGERISALLDSRTIAFFKGVKPDGSIGLKGTEPFIAYVFSGSDTSTAAATERKVVWSDTFQAKRKIWDWQGLAGLDGRTLTVKTPEGSFNALEIASPASEVKIPVDITLPDGVNSIGLWFDGTREIGKDHDNAIDKHVTFVLRINGRRVIVAAEMVDAPGTTPLSARFHPQGKYGDWILWQAFWDKNSGPAVLESIKISGGQPRKLMLGPVITEINATRPHLARQVWKLKSFSFVKPWSTHWTAFEYHEYGYDTVPFLRPVLWQSTRPEQVICTLTDVVGRPLAVWKLQGAALEQPLRLPELPLATYFVEMSILGKNHTLLARKRAVLQTLQGTEKLALPQTDLALLPCAVSGFERDGASGKPGDRVTFRVAVSSELSRYAGVCSWSINDSEGMSVKVGQEWLKGRTMFEFGMVCPRPGGYNLTLKFFSPENIELYAVSEKFGIGAEPVAAPAAGAVIAKEQGQPLMLSSIHAIFDVSQTGRLPQYTLPALIKSSIDGANAPLLDLHWIEIEPVRGCYNFYLIDRMLDLGALNGKKPWIGVSFSGDNIPEWLWFDELTSQDNRTIHLDYHYVNPMGRRFTAAHRELYRNLFERYKNDPRLGGWFYYSGPSEGFLTDTSPMICGYGVDDRNRFRDWLKVRYRSDLFALNKEWRASFADWNAVQPPFPDWAKAWEDSAAWRDFTAFKQDFVVSRLDELHKMFREIDPTRPALMYAKEGFGATGALAPVFKKYRVRYSNGGGETFMSYVQSCIMNNFEVPVTCEGHYVMPNSGSVFYVMANSILAGNYGGNNIQWGLVWAKKAHDQMPETQMIMHATRTLDAVSGELKDAVPVAPRWAGYFSSVNSLYTKREFRLKQNPSMDALNNTAQILLHAPESWVDDYTPAEIMSRYPVIVDADSRVIEDRAMNELLEYVKSGHTLVASLWTGRFHPGTAIPADALARAVGVVDVGPSRIATAVAIAGEHRIELTGVMTPRWNVVPEVIAADAAGVPLLWKVSYGKGTVILAAGNIDFVRSAAWLKSVIEHYSGPVPYTITADKNIQAGTVANADYNFIVVHPLVPGDNRNASIEQMKAAGDVKVRITGKNLSSAQEMMFNTKLIPVNDGIEFSATPGMFYLIKVKKN